MKEKINALAENQMNLFSALYGFAGEAAHTIMPDTAAMNDAKTLMEEYRAKGRELTETFFAPKANEKFWESFPVTISKAIELNTDAYNKTMNCYRSLAEKYNSKTNQETWNKLNRIYKDSCDAIVKTAESNFKTISGQA